MQIYDYDEDTSSSGETTDDMVQCVPVSTLTLLLFAFILQPDLINPPSETLTANRLAPTDKWTRVKGPYKPGIFAGVSAGSPIEHVLEPPTITVTSPPHLTDSVTHSPPKASSVSHTSASNHLRIYSPFHSLVQEDILPAHRYFLYRYIVYIISVLPQLFLCFFSQT